MQDRVLIQQNAGEMEVRTILAVLSSLEPFRNMAGKILLMKKGGKSLEPVSKEYIDKVLTQNNIKLENNVGYDYVFVGNMCKADYYGSSITDERHFALYIKDTIDDEDAGDGTTMRRWYATMVANGTMVDWEDVI